MPPQRKLSLDEFFDRIETALRFAAPASPRRRIRGDAGLMIWRDHGHKTGLVVSPALGGAFVFLDSHQVQITALPEAIDLLKGVFAGDIVEVEAKGPRDHAVWLARADAPASAIRVGYSDRWGPHVPVFTAMTLRPWPGARRREEA